MSIIDNLIIPISTEKVNRVRKKALLCRKAFFRLPLRGRWLGEAETDEGKPGSISEQANQNVADTAPHPPPGRSPFPVGEGRELYRFSSSGITPRLEMVLGVISPASVRAILVRIGPTSS